MKTFKKQFKIEWRSVSGNNDIDNQQVAKIVVAKQWCVSGINSIDSDV